MNRHATPHWTDRRIVRWATTTTARRRTITRRPRRTEPATTTTATTTWVPQLAMRQHRVCVAAESVAVAELRSEVAPAECRCAVDRRSRQTTSGCRKVADWPNWRLHWDTGSYRPEATNEAAAPIRIRSAKRTKRGGMLYDQKSQSKPNINHRYISLTRLSQQQQILSFNSYKKKKNSKHE